MSRAVLTGAEEHRASPRPVRCASGLEAALGRPQHGCRYTLYLAIVASVVLDVQALGSETATSSVLRPCAYLVEVAWIRSSHLREGRTAQMNAGRLPCWEPYAEGLTWSLAPSLHSKGQAQALAGPNGLPGVEGLRTMGL